MKQYGINDHTILPYLEIWWPLEGLLQGQRVMFPWYWYWLRYADADFDFMYTFTPYCTLDSWTMIMTPWAALTYRIRSVAKCTTGTWTLNIQQHPPQKIQILDLFLFVIPTSKLRILIQSWILYLLPFRYPNKILKSKS